MWEFLRTLVVKENAFLWILVFILLAKQFGVIDKAYKYFKWKKEKEEPSHQHRRDEDAEGDSSTRARLQSLERNRELNEARINKMENTIEDTLMPHVVTGTEVRVKIGVMENDIKNMKENHVRLEGNDQKLFNYVGEIKDNFVNLHKLMVEMGIGKK